MKYKNIGAGISEVEALNVSPHGFWLMITGREFFLPYDDFPWFCKATNAQLFNVEIPSHDHLYWPELSM